MVLGGLGYPLLFMTDDSASERNALSSVYPSSRLLLCLFHLAQALWRWLWASENHILNEDRKPIMNMFQCIIYSSCIEEAESQYDIMLTESRCKTYPHLMAHIASIWERRTEWCLYLRKDVITRGNNTNNYVEASIRIFKDIVLQRCKAFNACALVDFIVSVFETYHKKHLLEFANSRRSQPKLSYLAFSKKAKISRCT
ncbi:hypothetical protein NQ314_008571 [Rhamnusium bicolor]|uniref:MULE transposase domain-containing protein n=1 Tax=Rhamnusium bicolor TaxID=1586634 RepID=A0AAV8YAY3_9CUCU|nr:hypothetical protein NQ314_008571 [Rhamnusium bicolor]